jgi:hypothetical protein
VEPDTSGLTFRPALLAAGLTEGELRRLRTGLRLTPLRPGVYVPCDDARLDDPGARHVLAVRAAVPKVAPDAVVSHASAAVLHGLTLWGCPLRRVHVTRPRRSGGRVTRLLHVHSAALAPDEIVQLDGMAVTSVARTVVDLARSLPFEAALVTADAALHRHRVTPAELATAVDRSAGRTGNPSARRVVAAADARAESPGETRSRVAIARAGLPTPALQHVVAAVGAEVDFWWEEFRTVGEFDGRVKYGRLLRAGQDPGDVVFAEKRREDALRDLDLGVVRWVWDDLSAFDAVAARLRRAFARGCR